MKGTFTRESSAVSRMSYSSGESHFFADFVNWVVSVGKVNIDEAAVESMRQFRTGDDADNFSLASLNVRSKLIKIQTLSWKDAIRKRHGML